MTSTNGKPNVEGLSTTPVVRERHAPWYPPQAAPPSSSSSSGLRVYNSLTETVEPFAPREGRTVRWYTCGPTVYDHCHMGHARAYLTFDIIRRIMEDYFGYSVVNQMNITDIDDKIIKGARVNKLLSDFKGEVKDNFAALHEMVKAAVAAAEEALVKKGAALEAPIPASASKRVHEEREDQIKQLALKKEQLAATKAAISKAVDGAAVDELFVAARGVLGERLDALRGSTVTEQTIFDEHSRRFEQLFFEDCERLGIRAPDVVTRVTEYVPQVVAFVEKIIENGFGYVGKSSVFFDTEAFQAAGHDYAKLRGITTEKTTEAEMAEGEGVLSGGVEGEKKSPNDFALWKLSKPGEPRWPSPWGDGRPGWHIECSVMASDVLGSNIDIHAGGWDLKFPHHDNELAQSEAYWNNHQWINYFLHCGHLHIKGLKMSKSLKNFITIRQAFEEGVTPREMRILFLLNNWGKPMNFSDQSIGEAREKERVLRAFFGSLDVVAREFPIGSTPQRFTPEEAALTNKLTETDAAVHAALCNDFDTPTAMAAILSLVSHANQYILAAKPPSALLLSKVGRFTTHVLRSFGLVQGADDVGFTAEALQSGDSQSKIVPVVNSLVLFRDNIRRGLREKKSPGSLLAECDVLRDEVLPPLGIRLEDKPDGSRTQWKWDDPAVLLKEQAARLEQQQRDKEEQKKKVGNIIETKEKLYRKWAQYTAVPTEYFRGDAAQAAKYGAYDNEGTPLSDAAGTPLTEKQIAKLKKEQKKYADMHMELGSKGGDAFLKATREEIEALRLQMQQ